QFLPYSQNMTQDSTPSMSLADLDRLLLGKRLRHFRTQAGLTLDQLGGRVGIVASQLSLFENGRREPKPSMLQAIARELGITTADLMKGEAPDRRSALEIELERSQSTPAYTSLNLPHVRAPRSLSDDTLEALVGLHRALARRSRVAATTSEEARRANTVIRMQMRERDNYRQ